MQKDGGLFSEIPSLVPETSLEVQINKSRQLMMSQYRENHKSRTSLEILRKCNRKLASVMLLEKNTRTSIAMLPWQKFCFQISFMFCAFPLFWAL